MKSDELFGVNLYQCHLCPALFLSRYWGYPLHRREKLHQMSYDGTKCIVLYFIYRDGCIIIVYTYHDSVVCIF